MSPDGSASAAALVPPPISTLCFHCGLPVPPLTHWQVDIDGTLQPMCCPGCEAVASSIVSNGLSDYYRNRSGFSETAAMIPPELALYDTTPMAAASTSDDGELCEATFSVEGIRCAACIWLIEGRLARLPGMQQVGLNVATGRLHLRWRRQDCKVSTILLALRQIGYPTYPFDPVRHDAQLERARKTLFRQVFIAGLSMMQVMMVALPVYLATDGSIDAGMVSLMRWAGLLLTLPAIGYSARPFFGAAWRSLKALAPGMDVPVSIGILAAFGASLVATWRGAGVVYFDSVTMFIFLLLCSRYLELGARRKAASALNALHHALPASALRLQDLSADSTDMVAANQLRVHDRILVRPGEAIVADAVVLQGVSAIDVSLLTGESAQQKITPGCSVPGGAINLDQTVVLRVTRPAVDSTLSVLVKLVEQAGLGKPRFAQQADYVATWFVTVLLLFALAAFLIWHVVDPTRAWSIAIAILVVSCPCALSLATPTALAAATDRLVRQGVLMIHPHVLETLQSATHVVFDKTGTLTLGKPSLQQLEIFGERSRNWCLHVAAALEQGSSHPLGVGIVTAAVQADLSEYAQVAVLGIQHHPGEGLSGSVDGCCYRLGSAAFVASSTCLAPPEPGPPDITEIYLAGDDRVLARFDLADTMRPDAAAVVTALQRAGKKVLLLSGDRQQVAQRVADQLGIDTALGDTLPQQKLAFVQSLQSSGAVVAMVGDGINDAAVLRAADVSFAMGGGAALAQINADCVLLAGRLSAFSDVVDCATRTLRVVHQNLAWATAYNLVAIPAAALGLLAPWMSAVGMSASSAVVVLNALRLRRIGTAARPGAMPPAERR